MYTNENLNLQKIWWKFLLKDYYILDGEKHEKHTSSKLICKSKRTPSELSW